MEPKHITILSDEKYLVLGMTCIRSLSRTTSIPLVIHYYCVDEETFKKLSRFVSIGGNNVKIIPYRPESIYVGTTSNRRNQFLSLRTNEYKYFLWTLASYFTKHVMDLINAPVTYIDSDIVFHKDIALLFNEFGSKDCGIFKHRFLDDGTPDVYQSGKYNVGVVYFKNSNLGKELLDWWSDGVLFKKYPEYATCGDQKYLEYFPKRCSKPQLYIDDNIGHGAPWDWQLYDTSELSAGFIGWNGKRLPHVFSHFSKFGHNFEKNTFECVSPITFYCPVNGNNIAYQSSELLMLHARYFEDLKVTNNLLTPVSSTTNIQWGLSRLR